MFFFELLFLCFHSQFPSMLSPFISFIQSLICFLSRTLEVKNIKKAIYLVTGNSLDNFTT